MKRKNNLYQNLYKLENINNAFKEVCRNTKNKNKVNRYKEFKCANIAHIYTILKEKRYVVGKPFKFIIYEPKKREILSQNMQDKIVNHLVSRQILYPSILPCLVDENVASRENKGTKAGLDYFYKYNKICKMKYGTFYILKCDIHKFFQSIDKNILKTKLLKKIKDKDAIQILFHIIDSEQAGLGIRLYDLANTSCFLSKRLRPLYKRRIKNKILCQISRRLFALSSIKRISKRVL